MAEVIITLKIMPSSPDVNLEEVYEKVNKLIAEFGGEVGKKEEEPVAFGLNALKIFFVMNEDKGRTDSLEEQITHIDTVNSVDVVDVRRAIG